MTRTIERMIMSAGLVLIGFAANGQYRSDLPSKPVAEADSSAVVITLEDALKIALSENVSVKVADKEIERSEYAKKGTYSSLFPQINGSGSYQRTIKKQIMYMDSDSDEEGGGGFGMLSSLAPYFQRINELSVMQGMPPIIPDDSGSSSSNSGFAVGRWNTYNYGVSAALPLINAQLWESLRISGQAVDLAVEKARSSRLDMVTQVKQAFYAVLLAKEAFNVYKDVYENAVENFLQTEKRFNAEKASELEYTRAKSVVAGAIPNVYNAESSVILALWQLKAVMGVDLDRNIDVAGELGDYASQMFRDIHDNEEPSLEYNTTLRQLEIQADQLASTVRMYKAAYAPTLSAAFAYNMIAMTNDFKFSEYKWSPYSYVGLSLNIPIFTGGKRHYDVQQAKIQSAELNLQRIDAERQLRIAIRQYLNTMETSMNSYNSAAEAVGLAQKAYDIAAKSYKVGKGTITDMNDAQLTLTQASLQQSQAVYNFVVAKSNLEKTIGYDFVDENGQTDLDNM
ncbi:MAG: TolC family protein [Bacteroidales bacterium]|nr:TolC family protein [Bacteroidales bacterium]